MTERLVLFIIGFLLCAFFLTSVILLRTILGIIFHWDDKDEDENGP